MTYQETIEYLFQQLPMFQRVGAAAYKANLNNTHALCNLLGNPQDRLRFVHVAGTNGKGSVSHMTAAVLQAAGYKTGLFTSPHMKDFRERIKVNGALMERDAVVAFVEQYASDWQTLQPSFFEITFAMALWYFERSEVDIVVLETGMGGRLDSTNVVRPLATAITNVGFDHMQFLGDTLEAIASEKAGIVKTGVPIVLGNMVENARKVIEARALAVRAPMHMAPKTLNRESDLKGPYQGENMATAVTLLGVLREKGLKIGEDAVNEGLRTVVQRTGLLGRWQLLATEPTAIADCAHNEDGLRMVLEAIKSTDYHNFHFVLGFSGDKDIESVLPLFPKLANYYFVAAKVPRAMDAEELKERAAKFGMRGEAFSSVRKAYEAARLYAGKRDLIYIGGSVFVVAEIV